MVGVFIGGGGGSVAVFIVVELAGAIWLHLVIRDLIFFNGGAFFLIGNKVALCEQVSMYKLPTNHVFCSGGLNHWALKWPSFIMQKNAKI